MRNPLNAVLGWTRILIDRKDVDAGAARRARCASSIATRAAQARMIDDLLDVARIASGKLRLEMQPVDLARRRRWRRSTSSRRRRRRSRSRFARSLDPQDAARPGRSAAAPADRLEPALERGEVHRRRRARRGAACRAPEDVASGRRRHGPRHQPRIPAVRLRAVSAERQLEHAAARRPGARARARPGAGRAARRHGGR